MIPARVLTRRDDARVAFAVTGSAVGLLELVLLDDLTSVKLLGGPSGLVYSAVAAAIVLAGVAPWLAWTRRGEAVMVKVEPGAVVIGEARITRADVTGLSVARAARGRSVAIARGERVTFLEIEREEDASRIAAALSGPALVGRSLASMPEPSRALAGLQAIVSFAGLFFGPMYFLATVLKEEYGHNGGKALYGVGGLVATFLALLVLAVRRLSSRQAVAVRRGAWDAHVALHREAAESGSGSGSQSSVDDREREREAPPLAARALARGDEPVRAWLARLDAAPDEGHVYRGDAVKKGTLWETLGDEGAPADARMAAARVLTRRHGTPKQDLVRVVADPDVRVRVEAAMEDEDDDAERRIEELGPLFRAR